MGGKGSLSAYQVGASAVEYEFYRMYVCTQTDTGRVCLLQVATSTAHNAGLDRQAYRLRDLAERAEAVEQEYARVKTDPNSFLNYGLGFPEVVDSFICKEQGSRRINILAFRNVDDVRKLVPLDNLTLKDKRRIDLRTSVWIMGKLLKLLTFAHSEGYAVGLMTGNVLIEPIEHYALIFDWSLATTADPGSLSEENQRNDVRNAARVVVTALGNNLETGTIPDVNDTTRVYADFLLRLMRNAGGVTTQEAHQQFYKLADSIWPREYYPFTTLPL